MRGVRAVELLTPYVGKEPAKEKSPVLGHSVSDGDRVGLKDDKTADSHPARVSTQSTSATSEPASSTLLTPLRAQYHKFAVASPWLNARCPDQPVREVRNFLLQTTVQAVGVE